MKVPYQITGTTRLVNYVRIFLDRQSPIKEKQGVDVFGALKDFNKVVGGMQQQMQQEAILAQQPDVITIPFNEWEKKHYKIGDYIWIDFDCGD